METSDGGGIGVDCGVGTIVWVRRRNGSWWPGRILGLNELSTSHLMSPRSGTPVKLLGREDASVDWYNLEKSKRVKAFRCGEFDACIERAEASQSTPIKKREKYARREDAILHALELEKKQKLGGNSNGICTIPFGAYNREATALSSPETYIRHDKPVARGKLASCKRESFLKKAAFSHEGVDTESPLYKEGSNQQFNLEHDNAEAITRMRGLQDFGIKLAHYKRKTTLSGNWENSSKSVNNVDSLSSSGYVVRGADEASTSRNDSLVKKKRSYGSIIDEFIVKKRDRRRPLVQVLQSSAKLPFHSVQLGCTAADTLKNEETEEIGSTWTAKRSRSVCFSAELDGHTDHVLYASKHMSPISKQLEMCDGLSYSENKDEGCSSSGLIEATDSDCCEADFSEPAMVEETDLLIGTADTLLPESKDCDPPEFQVSGDLRSLIQEDVPLSGFMFQLHGKAKHTSKVSVSKWRMKGKRNIRNVGKRLSDAADSKVLCPDLQRRNGPLSSTAFEGKDILKYSVAESPSHGPVEEEFEYACDENKDFDQNQLSNVYSTVQLNGADFSLNNSDVYPHDLNPFWEEPLCQVYAKDANSEMEPLLVDVDLRVQTSYQGEHVPLVSLMSRLNGKAIIGHPVQIEILEEGSVGLLVSSHDAVMDENTATQAVWRTARRTAMQRVPRSIPLTTSLEEDDNGTFPSHKEPYYHYLKHQVRTIRKGTSLIRRRSSLRKFQKKTARRVSASSKKTRTLSSLASEDKAGGEYDGQKLNPSNDILEGLIKAEVPLVTCIPVKVVFSRILEAVSRHRMRMSSPGSQDP